MRVGNRDDFYVIGKDIGGELQQWYGKVVVKPFVGYWDELRINWGSDSEDHVIRNAVLRGVGVIGDLLDIDLSKVVYPYYCIRVEYNLRHTLREAFGWGFRARAILGSGQVGFKYSGVKIYTNPISSGVMPQEDKLEELADFLAPKINDFKRIMIYF